MPDTNNTTPLYGFNFLVTFTETPLSGSGQGDVTLCEGAFSEVSGLDATMEPKSITEGGRNYGTAQRVGPVTFATVILRRGITRKQDLWTWFDLVTRQYAYPFRLQVKITIRDVNHQDVMSWILENALVVKFKVPDLRADQSEIGVEELHLVHEGLSLARQAR